MHADARHLSAVMGGQRFDAAIFLFSLQNVQPLEELIVQAAASLVLGGLLLAVLLHPCFRVPRFSG